MTSIVGKFRGLFGSTALIDPGLPLGQIRSSSSTPSSPGSTSSATP